MSEMNLVQAEADALIGMEKRRLDDTEWIFPLPGERLTIPLTSTDKRENFTLDVTRGRIRLLKASFQNRARQAVVLLRLDVSGSPHINPDGQEIPRPHMHVYREGHADKWAYPASRDKYPDPETL